MSVSETRGGKSSEQAHVCARRQLTGSFSRCLGGITGKEWSMRTRIFGTTGRSVSEIGLGCWQLGGDFGPISDDRAMEILATAVDAGVNFLDTADVYGAGRSERLIGDFLKIRRESLFVATKVGRGGGLFPDGYSEASVRQSLESSLERLGMESLDLVQLHCVPPEVLREGVLFDWLRKFREEGLIRAFGASVETVEEGHLCLRQEGLASLQVIFNLFRQKPLTELFPDALKRGVALIVRLPLASGLLAGKFTADSTFAEKDHRHYNRDGAAFNVGETFAGLRFEKGVELADALKPRVPEGVSMAQWAQRWILDHPAVSTVITGASSAEQVKANAAVSGLSALEPQEHAELARFYRESVAEHIRGLY